MKPRSIVWIPPLYKSRMRPLRRLTPVRLGAIFWILVVWTGCAVAQTVEGVVINSGTGKGIGAVQVRIVPASRETSYSATTDVDGHFVVEGLKPGTYAFGYQLANYAPSAPKFPQIFQVTTGSAVKLEGRMLSFPRVSGRVVDGRGDAVANAKLTLVGRGNPSTTSDAKGLFDLQISPGSYFLSVVPPSSLKAPEPEPDSHDVRVWTRTFYPGVASLEAASKINATPGTELSGIEIKILATRTHTFAGVLLNPDGTPVPNVPVTLSEDLHGEPSYRTESGLDGVFEFHTVKDGEWCLSAESQSHGRTLRGTDWIEVAGHDLGGTRFRLAEPVSLRGKLVTEGPKGSATSDSFPVYLVPRGRRTRSDTGIMNWMVSPEFHFVSGLQPGVSKSAVEMTRNAVFEEQGAIRANIDADGNFLLENVYPGSYRVIAPAPAPYYFASLRFGGNDLPGMDVDVSSGAIPVAVVFRNDGGSVRGTVEGCATGVVLLIPQEASFQSVGFLRSVGCDSQNRYEFTTVRPGSYFALAFAGSGPVPPLDDTLLKQGSTISVRAGEASSADLRALPRP